MSKRKVRAYDKYALYRRAVQAPDVDVDFFLQTYRELKKARPRVLREDFCGAFAICCEWVKKNRAFEAFGIDLDPEPLKYGHDHYLTQLKPQQAQRVHTFQTSVLTAQVPKADIIVALNFSYYLFKSRLLLRQYFSRARKGLKRNGIFIVDAFGGPSCHEANTEKTRIGSFDYFWEQKGFNPITHEAKFAIHFKRPGEAKRSDVFTYDWRMWTLPEIRETMLEAGFRKAHVYWEGSTRSGNGNGIFTRQETGEECDAWIAYVVGE